MGCAREENRREDPSNVVAANELAAQFFAVAPFRGTPRGEEGGREREDGVQACVHAGEIDTCGNTGGRKVAR